MENMYIKERARLLSVVGTNSYSQSVCVGGHSVCVCGGTVGVCVEDSGVCGGTVGVCEEAQWVCGGRSTVDGWGDGRASKVTNLQLLPHK